MNERPVGSVGWVQIGTDDPQAAKHFYGELLGWTYLPDPNGGGKYDLIRFPGADAPRGGILDTEGEAPSHAIFMIVVADVPAAVATAEKLGGKVTVPPVTTPTGLVFAELLDPAGNHFGVFTPPSVASSA
jgi:predicted enzyme related to lactoylglutathione lyase